MIRNVAVSLFMVLVALDVRSLLLGWPFSVTLPVDVCGLLAAGLWPRFGKAVSA